MFQRIGPAAYKHSLENSLRLDEIYKNPHKQYSTVHIAGTNGKGSVSHMLAAIFQSAGYNTGLFTSPHLVDFRERIRINGRMIPKSFVTRWVSGFRKDNPVFEPSFFELTAEMAFDYFADRVVDIAVIETGLGGRLDSTNIITPEASVITNISWDHASLLGNSLREIASEKAGIIKKGIPVIISQRQPEVEVVFREKAKEMSAPIFFASDEYTAENGTQTSDASQVFHFSRNGIMRYRQLRTDLTGIYQRLNIPAVLQTVDILVSKGWKIDEKAVYEGLSNVTGLTGLQGRWQVLGTSPLVVCDTGHNEEGIREVAEQLRRTPYQTLHFILGLVADKDTSHILPLLPKEACYYFTRAAIPRALDESILKEKAAGHHLAGKSFRSVAEAFRTAMESAGPDDVVFIGGSNFVVAEVLTGM
jgi:dihydrofolate synthase/folylpolyglutamate synthase